MFNLFSKSMKIDESKFLMRDKKKRAFSQN